MGFPWKCTSSLCSLKESDQSISNGVNVCVFCSWIFHLEIIFYCAFHIYSVSFSIGQLLLCLKFITNHLFWFYICFQVPASSTNEPPKPSLTEEEKKMKFLELRYTRTSDSIMLYIWRIYFSWSHLPSIWRIQKKWWMIKRINWFDEKLVIFVIICLHQTQEGQSEVWDIFQVNRTVWYIPPHTRKTQKHISWHVFWKSCMCPFAL